MADQESTPFLVAHDDEQDFHQDSHYVHPGRSQPANAHFKRTLRFLAATLTALAVGAGVVMIIAIVRLKSGPFANLSGATKQMNDLTIVAFVNAFLILPILFVSMPILIPLVANFVMAIVTLVFADDFFDNHWPDSWYCRPYVAAPMDDWRRKEPTPYCLHKLQQVQVMAGIAGGLSLATGILLLFLVVLRIIAIARTRFWQNQNMWRNNRLNMPAGITNIRLSRFTGFTVQCSFSIVPTRLVEHREDATAQDSPSRPVAAYRDVPEEEAAVQSVAKGNSEVPYRA